MPQISFTSHLSRHLSCETMVVEGDSLREAFEKVFLEQPKLRDYLLDDQRAVRKHVMIFVDSTPIADRVHLSDELKPESKIYIMQALSGG